MLLWIVTSERAGYMMQIETAFACTDMHSSTQGVPYTAAWVEPSVTLIFTVAASDSEVDCDKT